MRIPHSPWQVWPPFTERGGGGGGFQLRRMRQVTIYPVMPKLTGPRALNTSYAVFAALWTCKLDYGAWLSTLPAHSAMRRSCPFVPSDTAQLHSPEIITGVDSSPTSKPSEADRCGEHMLGLNSPARFLFPMSQWQGAGVRLSLPSRGGVI